MCKTRKGFPPPSGDGEGGRREASGVWAGAAGWRGRGRVAASRSKTDEDVRLAHDRGRDLQTVSDMPACAKKHWDRRPRLSALIYLIDFAAGSRGRLSLQDVVCAGRHVRNRFQIPLRAAIRRARGFAPLRCHFANYCEIPLRFAKLRLGRARTPSLRMTLGVAVRLRMTHGGCSA